jgi:broad-specificity NMP kinase
LFAVILTGLPGAGKTATLTALTDALIDDRIAVASADADEVAWAFPYPSLAGRSEHLRAWREAHQRAGHELLLVAEVIESDAHLSDVLAALGADDHLLVRLEAAPATLRERIVAREPAGWSGLDRLLGETESLAPALAALQGVHLSLDTERLTLAEIADRIRAARPDKLAP